MRKTETFEYRGSSLPSIQNSSNKKVYSSLKSLGLSKASSLVDTNQNQSSADALTARLRNQTSAAASLQKLNKQHYKLQPMEKKIQAKKRQFDEIDLNSGRKEPEINSVEGRFDIVDRLTYKYASINTKLKPRRRDQSLNFFDVQYERSIMNLLNIVVEKGKNIQEILAEKEIATETFSKGLFTDSHFMLCIKGLLMEMQREGEITKDIQYITKGVLNKIESFIIEKTQNKKNLQDMDEIIAHHTRQVRALSQSRLATLKNMLTRNSSALL